MKPTQNYTALFLKTQHPFYITIKWVVLPGLVGWSLVIEGYFFHNIFDTTIDNGVVRVCAVVFIVILLELIKLIGGKATLTFFLFGWWSKRYQAFMVSVLTFTSLAYGASVLISTAGVEHTLLVVSSIDAESSKQIQLSTKLDSINAYYDNRLVSLMERQKEAHQTTWKGSITVDASKLSRSIQETINQLEIQRAKSLEEVRSQTSQLYKEKERQLGLLSRWAGTVGGYVEVMILLCLLSTATYQKLYAIDQIEKDHEQIKSSSNSTPVFSELVERSEEAGNETPSSGTLHPSETVAHRKSNGEIAYYTRRDVMNKIATYEKRLLEKETKARRKALEYWNEKLNEFKT